MDDSTLLIYHGAPFPMLDADNEDFIQHSFKHGRRAFYAQLHAAAREVGCAFAMYEAGQASATLAVCGCWRALCCNAYVGSHIVRCLWPTPRA